MTRLMRVGERAGGLDAGRAGADDHEVQRALIEELRVAQRVLAARPAGATASARRVRGEYSGNACASAPGVLKKFGCEPMASTRKSADIEMPSALVTVLVAGSMFATSATRTETPARLRKTCRIGRATSVTFTCAVATWYSSGWNCV